MSVVLIFVIFRGFVWTFLCINWVFNAFMCIIQIWTTCTCSSAYKLVETEICVLGWMLRSHARNGNEFQTPGHRWLPAKHWDAWFLNLVNQKLVWNSWNLACYHGAASTCRGKIFVPFGAVWGCASHKPELLTTSMMVSVGNAPPLGTQRYPLPLIPFKKILVST